MTPTDPIRPVDRRDFLRRAVAGAVALGGSARAARAVDAPEGPKLIVRCPSPLDAETPVEVFDNNYLTPNPLFFVRSHLGAPAEGLHAWRLEIGGDVGRPTALGLDDLDKFEQVTVTAVLQCSGNGRALFGPGIPGAGWMRGAVGNAEWGGVRLAELLDRAKVGPHAAHVHFLGADAPPLPKTPAYLRSLPLDRATAEGTILALRMNGEALPHLHGGPLRLIVPGWTGNHWMKWLRRITVAAAEAPGTYQQSGYKMPRVPVPKGVAPKPADLVSVTALNVKSLISHPAREGQALPVGRHEVRGVAWTGEGKVVKVEVAVGERGWEAAELVGPDRPHAWRQWTFPWDADRPGRYALRVRATDSLGAVQPERSPWNKSGYLWNGIDELTCEVRRP